VLTQKPLLHVSVVQALPSLHSELVVHATQTPFTQDCPAGHVIWVFWHVPLLHVSVVQALPSLHSELVVQPVGGGVPPARCR
jgi:hypothetical protein